MTDSLHQQKIIIVDFGSQYTQLIARRIRSLGVYSEIVSHRISFSELEQRQPQGIILSGGPQSAHENVATQMDQQLIELNVPILGICYGMQSLAVQFGGRVEKASVMEFGLAQLEMIQDSPLLAKITEQLNGELWNIWMSHGDKVTQLPVDFNLLAKTADCPIAAIAHQHKPIYGIQFHPEVTHTEHGGQLLKNFAMDICGCDGLWKMDSVIENAIEYIQHSVGKDQVVLGLSGGVDSSVTAMLIHRAIGKRLTCIFVDNGLLRQNEAEQVMQMFAVDSGITVIKVDAQVEFLQALKGIEDPEHKRKVIGNTFIDIFEREAAQLTQVKWLAQGTIYPDVIESAAAKSGHAQVIKSHHNVGGLPEQMSLTLLEPLRELFKDEVRKIGMELGLPTVMINRHPFPGPGLGVRILGEIKPEYADILRQADDIFIKALNEAGWYDKVSQAFAVFLPVKSVGVVGDVRRYQYVISLRAVTTVDFMTAKVARLPFELLEQVSSQIINSIEQVSRVTYDISSKPPATIEWE